MTIFTVLWKEIRRQWMNAVGTVVGIAMWLYNFLRPTNVTIAGQSGLGGSSGTIAISLGIIGIITMVLFVALFVHFRRKR